MTDQPEETRDKTPSGKAETDAGQPAGKPAADARPANAFPRIRRGLLHSRLETGPTLPPLWPDDD